MELTVKAAQGGTDDDTAVLAAATMDALDLADGDTVRLAAGERVAAACARTGAGATTAEETVRLGGALRRSLDTDIGDTVTAEGVEPAPADRLTVSLPASVPEATALRLESALVGRVLVAGQILTAGADDGATDAGHTADASHAVPVHVSETTPEGVVAVEEWSTIRLAGEGADEPATVATGPGATVGYDDLGGLDGALARMRELIERPLAHPELFRRLGISPPGGVLLYGPPGTGKTRLVRAMAAEADLPLVRVAGSEVVAGDAAGTDPLAAALSEATETAPSVLFLDDLETLAGEEAGELGARRVARLVSMLDDLDADARVGVVGATTRPEALAPTLRQAGRFDREVEVPVPDRDGRREIFDVHTRSVPLADDVDLDRAAERTHGFVGADIERLVREAAMRALDRRGLGPEGRDDPIDAAALEGLTVDSEDIDGALTAIDPSALREVFVEVPDATWDDIGGLETTTKRLRETVQWPLEHPDAFDRVALQPAKGVLLSGPPGTGKTLLAKVVANEAESNFISIKGPELLDKYVGESEKGIREVFEKARENAPTVVFFDEIDAIAAERGNTSDSGVGERVVSQLLTELDGLEELEDVVVIATTNRPDLLDDALLRPGRFDRQIRVGEPDEAARREILAVHTRDRPLADDVDLGALAARTEGFVGADIEAVCREAASAAVREYVDDDGTDPDTIVLTADHFEAAMDEVDAGQGDGTGRGE